MKTHDYWETIFNMAKCLLTGLNYIIIKGSSGILNIANVKSRKGGCKMLLKFWDNE